MKKPIPSFESDQDAERFVETADLSECDLSGARPVQFEFDKKDAHVNMRLPRGHIDALKEKAQRRGIPYERTIEALGEWIQIQPSLYLLWTRTKPREVHELIRRSMNETDLLAVADVVEGFVSNYGALMNSFLSGSLAMRLSSFRLSRETGWALEREREPAAA